MKDLVRNCIIPEFQKDSELSWTSNGQLKTCVDPVPYARRQAFALPYSGKDPLTGLAKRTRVPWDLGNWQVSRLVHAFSSFLSRGMCKCEIHTHRRWTKTLMRLTI